MMVLGLFVAVASAQVRDTGAIFGVVLDPQGAVIPAVVVALTNIGNGQVRTMTANQVGEYVFSLLPVGVYNLTAERQGFQKYEQKGIILQANENVKADVSLAIGDSKTVVVVSAAVSQVETRVATLQETIDQARIEELPLNGRNPADLAMLTPGVNAGMSNLSGDYSQSGVAIKGQKTFSVDGSRNNNMGFTLDGGNNLDSLFNFSSPFPFPDALQEFSVETSSMMGQHGNSSAGSVNIVTKSGSNVFHGNVFEYVRNTALNANNFFSHAQDNLKRNQAGFTIGGPVLKNKLFFFGGIERLWIRTTSGSSQAQSMTAAERSGDFSGDPTTILDPLNNNQPFPGNRIPQDRLSPAAQNLLKLTPLPDADGLTRFTFAAPENDFQYIGRADYNPNAKNSLMFRLFGTTQQLPYHSPSDNIFAVQPAIDNFSQSATVSHTFVASPNLIAHTQITGTHLVTGAQSDFQTTMATLGVKVYAPSNDVTVNLFASGITFGTPQRVHFARSSEEIVHDWSWAKGQHTFSWGAQLSWMQYNEDTVFLSSGSYGFDGHITGLDRADFVLGQMSSFQQINGENENRRQPLRGFHFGDTWHLRPRLTLSYGIRWEPYTFFTDTKNRNQTFSPQNYAAGIRSKEFVNAPPGLLYYGDADPNGGTIGRSVQKPDLDNLGPRIGIAWDPFGDGKSSIRAGYGIYYDAPQLISLNNQNDVSPFSYSVTYNDGLFDNPYLGRESDNVFPLKSFLKDTPYQSPLFTILEDNKFISPYTQNWNLTIERQILKDARLRVGYLGARGLISTRYTTRTQPFTPRPSHWLRIRPTSTTAVPTRGTSRSKGLSMD